MFSDFGYSEDKNLGKPYDIKLLKRLWPFTKPYWTYLLCAVFLIIIITLLDLAIPYIIKVSIDNYIVGQSKEKIRYLEVDISDPEIKAVVDKNLILFKINKKFAKISFDDLKTLNIKDLVLLRKHDIKGLGFAAICFLLIIILNFVFNFVQVMIMEHAGQGIMHDLRMCLFGHIQKLPISFFNKTPVARLVTRNTNDIQNMHELFTSVIVFVFKDLFLFLGITAVLIFIHWQLALICFTILPFVFWASIYFSRQAREIFRNLRIKTAEINTCFSETIDGIKVIQLFKQENANYRKFKQLNHEFYLAGMEQIRIFALFMPLIELLSAVALALVIYFGGAGVISDKISLGVLVAFISYMRMFFRPIRDIAEKYNILQNAMSSAERIFLLLDETQGHEVSNNVQKIDKIRKIEFKNVFFEYVKNEPVLKNISLQINSGQSVAVVGPTGSGKTSLINLIIRFYDPISGNITVNDKNIKNFELSNLRLKIALVTQDPFLFSASIKDNIIKSMNDFSQEKFMEILKASNCLDIIEKMPEGIDTVLAEGGASVSSGERQLISIARAFAKNPDFIIMDEATSYIDSETEVKIQAALANLMESRTSMIVAHRLSTARNADKIIVLNRGQIIEAGTHETLMQKKGFYFKLSTMNAFFN